MREHSLAERKGLRCRRLPWLGIERVLRERLQQIKQEKGG
jgi:hypothetical protein